MEFIIDWALAFMLAIAPPGPWRGEPREETVARYADIAADAVAVAYDPDNLPLYSGKTGRARTAALLLSVAFHESSFRKDVDLGIGPNARGDSGLSWCLMQIKVAGGRTIEGFAGPDLVQDRKKCFTTGLAAMRRSFLACRANPATEWLSAYTSGSCSRGAEQSRRRIESLTTWLSRHPVPERQD
jgi:hypothetical protein